MVLLKSYALPPIRPTSSMSQLKTEAFSLHNKLEELEAKKAELQEQVARQETPDEERDRLLREVRRQSSSLVSMRTR